MDKDEALYKAFLSELEAIEHFRLAYAGTKPAVPLGREDPDVQRLIEAMAMFTARTRLASERSLKRSTLRVFRQHFPYILNPTPAMAMLQAEVSARYVEASVVPRGSEVLVTTVLPTTRVDEDTTSTMTFRTQQRVRILPMTIQGVQIFPKENKGFRLVVQFEAAFFRNDEIGELNLFVNHLNDFASSLTVLYQLKSHLVQAGVVFDGEVGEETVGDPVRVYFGAPRQEAANASSYEHPLQQARAFFHFPQQSLYVNVKIDKQPRNWESFTLYFDLKPSWPVQLRLNPDTFVLNTSPMVNLRAGYSDPIENDGTRDRYPIRHPDSDAKHVVCAVRGLYKITDSELVPLRPGVVGNEPDSYELELEGHGAKRRAFASFNMPDAFEEPVRVAIDAYWHQPAMVGDDLVVTGVRLAEEPVREKPARDKPQREEPVRVAVDAYWHQPAMVGDDVVIAGVELAERHVEGLSFKTAAGIVPGVDNPIHDSQPALLQLLSIKNQRFLERDDLLFLLQAMGVLQEKHFGELGYAIKAVSVSSKPFAKRSQGFKYIYRISFGNLDSSQLPLLDLFCAKLLELLTVWSIEEVVELSVVVPNLETELSYV